MKHHLERVILHATDQEVGTIPNSIFVEFTIPISFVGAAEKFQIFDPNLIHLRLK